MRRREQIVRILGRTSVHSQEELLELLAKEGFRVTQPTLSRDIRELGLAKTANGYIAPQQAVSPVISFVPRQSAETHLEHLLDEFAISATQAGNLVVVRTAVAGAQPLAVAIDAAGLDGVAGTIAGDDTIFIAVSTTSAAKRLTTRLSSSISPSRLPRRTRA